MLRKRGLVISEIKEDSAATENLETQNKKRAFLKIAGVVGLGAAASLFLPKKAEALMFGSNTSGNAAKETGGHLANIDTNTAPLVTAGAGGYVRQDSTNPQSATIALETGGNLAAIATNTRKFSFDGSSNLQVVTTTPITIGSVQLKDTTSTVINPATEDSMVLLRRIVRQIDSLATVDTKQRQRVTADAWGASIDTGAGASSAGTTIRVAVSSDTYTTTSITNFGGVDGRYLFIDTARNAYANGIRQNLASS